MKKLFALLLATLLVLSMAACGSSEETTENQTDSPAESTEAPPATNAAGEAIGDLAYILDNGKLIVGITEYEPMDYLDENNEWTGFDAELARMFAAELGVECEFFVIGDWGKKFMELETKSIDCVWNGMTITDEAKNNSSVSDPYVVNAQVVVMKADAVANYPDAASMADLVFAVEEGSAGQTAAEDAGFTTVAKQDQAGALMEVKSGASDACVIDITMAKAMTGEGTDYADLAAGISLTEELYGVSFRQGSNLTAKFNEFLAAKKADGSLQELAAKYELTLAD